MFVNRPDDGHLIDHFQIETAVDEGVGLFGIVRQQSDASQTKIFENLNAHAVIAAVDLMAQRDIGFDGVDALDLEDCRP